MIWSAEEDSGADSELVLPVSLEVSEFGVEVVGLESANPDVFGNVDVKAAADGEGERGVVAGRQLANRCREVAVEAVHASEESLAEGLEAGMVGDAHPDASHAVEEAQASVEVGDVAGGVPSHLGDSGEVMPYRHGEAAVASAHPEASAASDRRVGAHLAEGGVRVQRVRGLLGRSRQGERRQQRKDENSCQLVHRSSYSTVRVTVVERTRLPLVPVTVMM
jgi:hypothetical protein